MATGNTSRLLYPVEYCATKGLVSVPGSFAVTATPGVSSARGDGFSVAYTAVGEYTITFAEKYPGLVSASALLELADFDAELDLMVHIEVYNSSTGTVIIRVSRNDPATAAAVAADVTGLRVNFEFKFQKFTALVVTHA